MSAFLGPVHVKMYERILYQDTMTQALLDLAKAKGWNEGLPAELDTKAPAADKAPLETIIDTSNIHGWLSAAVDRCEQRFALTVCTLLKDHPERIDDLCFAMNALGKTYPLTNTTEAEQVFTSIHDVLLDGMPCDFPHKVTQSDTNELKWYVATCPHTRFWTDEDCGVENYYQLRDAWVDGALSGGDFFHSRPEPFTHSIKKGAHRE